MTADIRSPDVVTEPCFPTNPDIHKLGQGKQHVLAHEVGQGSLCRNCDCSGLDLHFWRKLCKNCGCRMDEHDVQLPNHSDHGQIIIGRLFHAKDHFETKLAESLKHRAGGEQSSLHSSTSSDLSSHKTGTRRTSFAEDRTLPTAAYNFKMESDKDSSATITEYSWVPVPDKSLVERYMQALPEEERPIVGSVGEQNRKSRLQYQLPLYDCNVEDARFADEKDKEVLRRFVENVRKHVIGVGQVKEVTSGKGDARSETSELDQTAHDIGKISLGPVKCKSCTATIPLGDVGIRTDHGLKEEMWHPNCFRCAQCDQLLVDMLYFYFQGEYYCGRHFADHQYPRCAGCDELIFAREYTFAEEKSWHFDHFACFKCDLRLGGHRYMTKNDQPHCIDCYMKYFARSCDTCREKIGADEKRLNYQEYHWHAKKECFHCRQCDMDLIGKKFLFKDRNLFCSSQCKTRYRNQL
ncbi:PET Domain [Parelaphostrongylus tenuis]|uniref:PET Domain n=1 Tax=Parelaphostrongylus tenuis TaxID=148309 RepID=A0AAD5R811_PARTN|nr:PET Domain [Parelaphostrongylus tenuis]